MEGSVEPTRIPLTRMRRAIARAMAASAQMPQFTVEADARFAALADLREKLAREGTTFSYSDVFTATCARSLVDHPHVYASFDDEAIIQHSSINVGIAVSLDDGLIAPAIQHADLLSVPELAAERIRLTDAAMTGTLTPQETLSATFTISNLGPLGVRRFRALVVPPQAAILAVGVLTPDALCSLSLSCDHRVLDGAPAARFLMDVIARLEHPEWIEPILMAPEGSERGSLDQ
jgi:pyruvate dehydrogenase E2 component (dihydrolipoamide acetyltransferase)